jgi:tetratricopeptide (TPR) repeat protein
VRFFLFFIFISPLVKSQEPDTVLSHILALQNDTERVNQLYKRGFSIRNTDPRLAYKYARQAEHEALKTTSGKHIAKSYNLLGVLLYKKGALKTAMNYHLWALDLRTKYNDILGIAHSQFNLANIYTDLNLLEKAEVCYLKSLAAYKEANSTERCANCLLNLGVIKQTLKQFDAAIENYAYALRIAEIINDQDLKSSCLNNMAFAYGLKGDVEKAIAYNEDALKLRIMMENTLEVADSYLNLAPFYMYIKDLVRAKHYLDTAAYIGKTYAYSDITHKALRNYATYFAEIKDYQNAYASMVKYEKLKDSLQVFQRSALVNYDFNEPSFREIVKPSKGIPNTWLFLFILASCIFIPYYLIRFKR